jgi:hypothetical protein
MTQTLEGPGDQLAVTHDPGIRDDLGMTDRQPGDPAASLKDLVATASKDISTLFRKEIELAKAEITITVIGVVKGLAPLIGALVFVLAAAFLLCFAIPEAYNELMPRPYAFLAGAGTRLVLAGLAGLVGKVLLGKIQAPTRTPVTLKDDIAWAKNPTKPAPTHDGETS